MLPNLPKKYERKEAKIDGDVLDWFYYNYDGNVLVEVKIKGNKMLPHQQAVQDEINTTGKFKYKFPDMGRRTPGDGIVLKKDAEAFCVTCDGRECVAVSDKKEFNFNI